MIELRVFACVLMVSACAGEPEVASVEQDIDLDCPWRWCGNSDEVAHYGLWQANLWGQPDANHFSLRTLKGGRAAIYKNNVAYSLSVSNGRITGWHSIFGTISGQALVGARLDVLLNYGWLYSITITKVRNEATFSYAPFNKIETYTMVWHEPNTNASTGKGLCNSILPNNSETKNFDLGDMLRDETVVFEGDQFDPERMTTEQTANDNWFNFGCAGHTLAKLYLNRATIHTQPAPGDWRMRQATLKMLVADYCGGGKPFTLAGEPIAWKGGLQTQYHPMAVLTDPEPALDARWDEKGATCILEPRMQVSSNPRAPLVFVPDALSMIQDECSGLPTCANTDAQDLDGEILVSANRVPLLP